MDKSFGSQTTLSGIEFRPAVEELEEAITLSNMATPKQNRKLHIPVVRIQDAQVGAGVIDFASMEKTSQLALGYHC